MVWLPPALPKSQLLVWWSQRWWAYLVMLCVPGGPAGALWWFCRSVLQALSPGQWQRAAEWWFSSSSFHPRPALYWWWWLVGICLLKISERVIWNGIIFSLLSSILGLVSRGKIRIVSRPVPQRAYQGATASHNSQDMIPDFHTST